jgi:hypothetical protein
MNSGKVSYNTDHDYSTMADTVLGLTHSQNPHHGDHTYVSHIQLITSYQCYLWIDIPQVLNLPLPTCQ